MKKICFVLCMLLTLISVTGCTDSGNNVSTVSLPSTDKAASQHEVSEEKSQAFQQIADEDARQVFDDFISKLDTSDFEAFTKSFSDKSDPQYISASYESLSGGFVIGEKACIYHENEEYIYAFKAAFNDGTQQITIIPVVIENGVPKLLLDQEILQKSAEIINDYICPECNGEGKDQHGVQCSQCDGFGYILHEKDNSKLTKEIV